jgi:ubiquinone/menaquinone biosynthesis C-methylase UbiE
MNDFNRQEHWEKVYASKPLKDMSWYQPTPKTSLELIHHYGVGRQQSIIDVGGGDSLLVDYLLDDGFTNITVLDISAKAIQRAQERLGSREKQVTWIVSDITTFKPADKFDCWHDRATFHFLTADRDIEAYLKIAKQSLQVDGLLIMGTFSDQGPDTCSGIPIRQYTAQSMTNLLKPDFEKLDCITIDHKTPFDTLQSFVFCSFKKLDIV